MAKPYQKAVSDNDYKDNGATVFKAGNAPTSTGSNITNSISLLETSQDTAYGSKVTQAVSPASSGHLGTYSAFTTFSRDQQSSEWLMRRYATTINGAANTLLHSGASDVGVRMNPSRREFQRVLGSGVNTSWNAVTGAITKSSDAGNKVNFTSIDGGTEIDEAVHITNAVPGELVYKTSAKLPTQADYKPRYSP
jgi:hypothetical protein